MKSRYFNRYSFIYVVLATLLFISSPVWAADSLVLSKGGGIGPWIYYEDTDAGDADWYTRTDWPGNENFTIQWVEGSSYGSPFRIEKGAATNLLYLDAAERIGINTALPAYTVDAIGNRIRLRNSTSGTARTIQMRTDGSAVDLESVHADLYIRSSLHNIIMNPYGSDYNVGIGTTAPNKKLHVKTSNGSASIKVEETSTNTEQNMFELENNGAVRFNFRNNTAGVTWSFFNRMDGQLAIGRPGVPGSEFLLSKTGNLTIKGSYYQGSSRAWKENIEPVDREMVLDKLATLPVMSWNYKSEDVSDRHMGPMAEDFYSAFGLGRDDKHIAPQDLASVAVAASQQLYAEVQNKDERIRELESQVSELKEQMSSLQQMFNKLALSGSFGNTMASLEGGKQAR